MTLNPSHLQHIGSFDDITVRARQAPLRAIYTHSPEVAWVYDHAHTSAAQIAADHPIHGHVICGEGVPLDVPISVHSAVGGESDFPCPGEILAAALASCLDTAIRLIANLKGVTLTELSVRATLGADVRGALMMDETVPVGFQSAVLQVEIKTMPELPSHQVNALIDAAERSCVILQTLRSPPDVAVRRQLR